MTEQFRPDIDKMKKELDEEDSLFKAIKLDLHMIGLSIKQKRMSQDLAIQRLQALQDDLDMLGTFYELDQIDQQWINSTLQSLWHIISTAPSTNISSES